MLLIRGRMGDREAKQVFFAAYEGLVKKRAASFYHHGSGRRQAAWVSEKPGRTFFISRRTENSVQLAQAVILKRTRRCMQGSCKQILGLADRNWGSGSISATVKGTIPSGTIALFLVSVK